MRTIQRDIDSISLSGIPITSYSGVKGGYAILGNYKINNHFVHKSDFDIIIMALKSLSTGFNDKKLDSILEKYLSVSESKEELPVKIDYSVLKEGALIQNYREIIEKAIEQTAYIKFSYRNVHGIFSERTIEPLVVKFKWYAWYLYGFDKDKKDFRTFKLSRMKNIEITSYNYFPRNNIAALISSLEKNYLKTCEQIEIWIKGTDVIAVEDFFPDTKKELLNDGNYHMTIEVPPNELLWKGFLLSLGNSVRIISPDYYRDDVIDRAKNFLSNYDI